MQIEVPVEGHTPLTLNFDKDCSLVTKEHPQALDILATVEPALEQL